MRILLGTPVYFKPRSISDKNREAMELGRRLDREEREAGIPSRSTYSVVRVDSRKVQSSVAANLNRLLG